MDVQMVRVLHKNITGIPRPHNTQNGIERGNENRSKSPFVFSSALVCTEVVMMMVGFG
jgi:hypothetical protein